MFMNDCTLLLTQFHLSGLKIQRQHTKSEYKRTMNTRGAK